MDSRQVSYEALSLMMEEYKMLKHRFSKVATDCWALYTYYNSSHSGYKFIFNRSAATEQELIDYVQRSDDLIGESKYNTYVIIPVKMNAIGHITTGSIDITKSFEEYKGNCKILLCEKDPSVSVINPNPRIWIEVDKITRFTSKSSSIIMTFTNKYPPENWTNVLYGGFIIYWNS